MTRLATIASQEAPYPRCDCCGLYPLVIRKAGNPTVTLVHRSERSCNITVSGQPEAKVRGIWRQWAIE